MADKITWCKDPDSWCLETDAPGIGQFSRALQVWCVMQGVRATVADAALAFNCHEDSIREAAEEHLYLFVYPNGEIGHDGQ